MPTRPPTRSMTPGGVPRKTYKITVEDSGDGMWRPVQNEIKEIDPTNRTSRKRSTRRKRSHRSRQSRKYRR